MTCSPTIPLQIRRKLSPTFETLGEYGLLCYRLSKTRLIGWKKMRRHVRQEGKKLLRSATQEMDVFFAEGDALTYEFETYSLHIQRTHAAYEVRIYRGHKNKKVLATQWRYVV